MKINNNFTNGSMFVQYGLMDYLTEAHVDYRECELDEEIKSIEQLMDDVCDDMYRFGDIGDFKEIAFSVKCRTGITDWVNAMRVIFNNMPALLNLFPETTPLQEAYLRMVTNVMRKWCSGEDTDASRCTLSEAVAMSLWQTDAKVCRDLCSVIDHADAERGYGSDGLIGKGDAIAATMMVCAQMYHYLSDENFIQQEFKFSALPEIINLAEGTVVKHWSNLFDATNLKDAGI